jgi:hypothetical protein
MLGKSRAAGALLGLACLSVLALGCGSTSPSEPGTTPPNEPAEDALATALTPTQSPEY